MRTAAALLASTWAALFALVHLYWAVGGEAGLPSDLIMSDHPRLLTMDLLAIPLCLVAGVMAAFVGMRRGSLRSQRAAWLGVAAVAGLALAHAVPPLTGAALRAIRCGLPQLSERERLALLVYEPWWLIGGAAFLALAVTAAGDLRLQRSRSSP